METRTEWAIRWPDGQVRPYHSNESPIGTPVRPPIHAYLGCQWVRRTVTIGEWEDWDGPANRDAALQADRYAVAKARVAEGRTP